MDDARPHRPLRQEREPSEIEVQGPRVRRAAAAMRGEAERHLQRVGDGARDLVLDREKIGDRAIEAPRPDVVACPRVDQLRGDPHRVAAALDAALHHRLHAEATPDLGDIGAPCVELERRGPRRDAQVGQLAEGVQDLLGDPVPEVRPRRIGRQVHERKDRDRPRPSVLAGGGVATQVRQAEPKPCDREEHHAHGDTGQAPPPRGWQHRLPR